MATIKEDFVSFELAKLLKEKGFDEHCFCINYPLPEGGFHNIILPNLLKNSMIPFTNEYKFCRYKEDFITIPTLQMTMKWLREVHNIHIVLSPNKQMGNLYGNIIFTNKNGELQPQPCSFFFGIYEDAVEEAVKYSLENLI